MLSAFGGSNPPPRIFNKMKRKENTFDIAVKWKESKGFFNSADVSIERVVQDTAATIFRRDPIMKDSTLGQIRNYMRAKLILELGYNANNYNSQTLMSPFATAVLVARKLYAELIQSKEEEREARDINQIINSAK